MIRKTLAALVVVFPLLVAPAFAAYGAIAYSPATGRYGYSFNYWYLGDAEVQRAGQLRCRRRRNRRLVPQRILRPGRRRRRQLRLQFGPKSSLRRSRRPGILHRPQRPYSVLGFFRVLKDPHLVAVAYSFPNTISPF